MEITELRLCYHWVAGDKSSGSIETILEDNGCQRAVSAPFEQLDFRHMMTKFIAHLQKSPLVKALIIRTDRENLAPLRLSEEFKSMLLEDPVAAIKSMDPPPPIAHAKMTANIGLRVGYDSFSDAFGDSVYVRKKGSQAECPSCGKWRHVTGSATEPVILCECSLNINCAPGGHNWWQVSTQALLLSNRPKFFLPRAWNKTPPWISHHDLSTAFNDYVKEKISV